MLFSHVHRESLNFIDKYLSKILWIEIGPVFEVKLFYWGRGRQRDGRVRFEQVAEELMLQRFIYIYSKVWIELK